MRFVDNGTLEPTDKYPANPNGSPLGIAAVSSQDGRYVLTRFLLSGCAVCGAMRRREKYELLTIIWNQGLGGHAPPGTIDPVRELGTGRQEGRVGGRTALAAAVLLGAALGFHLGTRVAWRFLPCRAPICWFFR